MEDPAGRPGTESAECQDLSVKIEPKARGAGYTVKVYDGLPEEGNEPVVTDELLPLFDESLKPPQQAPNPLTQSPCKEAIEETGDWLCRFLLRGKVGELFFQRVEEVGRQAGKKLRVRLCWNPKLYELEWGFWEALRVAEWESEGNRPPRIWSPFVWLNPVLSLVRHPLGATTRPALSFPGRLKILILYANPKPEANPSYAEYLPAARRAIFASLKTLQEEGWVEVISPETGMWGLTPEKAEKAIADHNPHILIILAHGHGAGYSLGDGGFFFSDGRGGTTKFEGPRLAEAVRDKEVRLVFAPVCYSAALARALSLAGVPALVGTNAGMRFPDSHDVERWSAELFGALAWRLPVEECMHRARAALSRNPGVERPEWILPTLYLTAPDGKLFGSEEDLLKGSYLEKLKAICNHFPTEVFNPDRKDWTVSEKYVQTKVKEEVKRDEDRERARAAEETVPRQVEEALQEHGQVTVVADAGTGKSTLLHDQARKKARLARGTEEERIPILIRLKDWNGKGPLKDFLRVQHPSLPMWGENLLGEKIGEWLSQQYEQGKCILFFDALDEVEQSFRQDVVEALNGLRSPFILTTRPAGYDGRLRAKKVELLVFSEEQIQKYVTRYLGAKEAWERFSAALADHPGTGELETVAKIQSFSSVDDENLLR